MKRFVVLALLLTVAGCGGESPQPATPTTPAAPNTAAAAPAQPAQPAPPAVPTRPAIPEGRVAGYVRVVDLEGKPLADMAPIATLQPNAFDEPLATGALTGPDGRSVVYFPADQRVCIRAWDPQLHMFANNFREVLPNTGNVTDEMEIVMVPGVSLRAQFMRPDGAPAANENVGIMLFHPTRGPWWPAQADADATGVAQFPTLPPGRFIIKIKTASGATLELPDVSLPPGQDIDFGTVTLQ